MSSRSYLSIGDVLTLLRQEFPDVTISKIRFLESQGLVNPERTPSGYRKFYEHDVERLRWVLRQQREHFLPLKVIKDRLDDDANGTAPGPSPADGTSVDPETHLVDATASVAAAAVGAQEAEVPEDVVVLVGSGIPTDAVIRESTSARPGADTPARLRTPARATIGPPEPSGATPDAVAPVAALAAILPVEHAHRASMAAQAVPTSARTRDASAANGSVKRTAASGSTDHATPPVPSTPKPATGIPRKAAPSSAVPAISAATSSAGSGNPPAAVGVVAPVAGLGGAPLSLEDLCSASGLTAHEIAQLQEYALLSSTVAAGVEFFDEEALAVASLSAQFATFGIEARHLRLYKNAADREAGFIEQIVIPMVRQRNPEARARATLTAEDLSNLGQQLKASLLRTALRNIL